MESFDHFNRCLPIIADEVNLLQVLCHVILYKLIIKLTECVVGCAHYHTNWNVENACLTNIATQPNYRCYMIILQTAKYRTASLAFHKPIYRLTFLYLSKARFKTIL